MSKIGRLALPELKLNTLSPSSRRPRTNWIFPQDIHKTQRPQIPTSRISSTRPSHRKRSFQNSQPLNASFTRELHTALKHIRPKQKINTISARDKLLHQMTERASSLSSRPEDPQLLGFIQSIFVQQESQYRKSVVSIQQDAVDTRTADKLLQEANKILKAGIKRKSQDKGGMKGDIQEFWDSFISKKEVIRWDLFQQSFLLYLQSYMICDQGYIRKVNFQKLFELLYKDIADFQDNFQMWPTNYSWKQSLQYKGKIMRRFDFIKCVFKGQLVDLFKKCLSTQSFYIQNMRKKKQYKFADGSVYTGQWKGGKKQGRGELILTSGQIYTGNFVRGLRQDYGTMQGNDYSYKGDWKNDKFHGYGSMTFPDKSNFQGMWANGNMINGTLKWGGFFYTGEWKHATFQGSGSLTYPDGQVHKGYWKQGQLFGQSTVIKPNGDLYTGIFVDGFLEGEGKLKTKEFIYKGEFSLSKPNGYGRMKFPNKEKYEGEFLSGVPHGIGSFITESYKYRGNYEHGTQTGQAKIQYTDGRKYQGDVLDGQLTGQGTIFYPAGHKFSLYQGNLVRGVFEGKGKLVYADGAFYQGDWQGNLFSGQGVLQTLKARYEGGFLEGKCSGHGELKDRVAYYVGIWENGKPDGRGDCGDWDGELYNGVFASGVPVGRHKLQKEFLDLLNEFCFN